MSKNQYSNYLKAHSPCNSTEPKKNETSLRSRQNTTALLAGLVAIAATEDAQADCCSSTCSFNNCTLFGGKESS